MLRTKWLSIKRVFLMVILALTLLPLSSCYTPPTQLVRLPDGSQWAITGVSFTNSIKEDNNTIEPAEGHTFLEVDFERRSEGTKILFSFSDNSSNEQVYLTDLAGDKCQLIHIITTHENASCFFNVPLNGHFFILHCPGNQSIDLGLT
jgi:hypothetical protein